MTRAVIWCAVSSKKQADDDKDSLPVQETEARQLCAKNGWEVAEVLRVPGHSRRARDIHEVAHEMNAKGIKAFKRLIELWKVRGFDVLICRDGDRFARSQSLFARVVEETILGAKAEIYSMSDGIVDKHNFRMWISMCGYKAASDVDKLLEYNRIGIAKRVREGLPRTRPILSHRVIPKTKKIPARMVLREGLELLWNDLYTVFVERKINYRTLEWALHTEYGHSLYSMNTFYRLMYNPFFWGNSALNFDHRGYGAWAYDPEVPAPDGVTVHYGTHQAVYTGERAKIFQAEMRRRNGLIGRMQPGHAYSFTGMLVCDHCGTSLVHRIVRSPTTGNPNEYYCCRTNYMPGLARCEAKGQNQIRNKIALQGFDDLLRMMLHEGSPAMIEQVIKPVSQDGDLIMAELNALTTQLTNLIDDQAQATTRVVRDLYRTKISAIETQITVLNQRLDDLNLSTEPRQMIEDRHLAFAEIQRIGLESFWGLSSTQINHLLHRLFGNVRIAVRDKQLVGLTDQPRNRRRPRK